MKHLTALFFTILILLSSTLNLFAQRSAAELISSMAPPQGKIQYKDGVRQINIVDDYLFITNFWAGLQVVDISDIKNPRETAFFQSDDESYYTHIDGNYAYMSNHAAGVQVFDISDRASIRQAATVVTPGNALWAIAEDTRLYVALGNKGFTIMDIANLDNPTTVHTEAPGHWVQQITKSGNYLYAAAKKNGLLIYDISEPTAPKMVARFRTAFNTMMVQIIDDIAYVADGPGGLVILDVSQPDDPKLLDRFSNVGFVTNLYKTGTYVYLANRDVGLQIVNVSDPASPFLESYYSTADISYGVYKRDIYVFLAANAATLIMRHNNAPILTDIEDQRLDENVPFSLQLQAEEPDGDFIAYEALNLPEGATFDKASGFLSWTPTYEQSGAYNNIILQVIEQTGTGLTDQDTISLIVKHINRLPDLPGLESTAVAESAPLTITLPEGSDPDAEDQQRLAYRAENLPEGATFDPVSRTLNWTPTFEQSGTYVVDFLIDDGADGLDREPVTITVGHVDRPPVIDGLAARQVNEAAEISFQISGEEPDEEDQDKISFELKNLPAGATFDAATQTFNWVPGYDQSGVYNNLLAIMNAGNLSDSTYVTVAVDHVNRSPVLDAVANQTVLENQLLTFTISGSDPDVEDTGKLVFTAGNLPEGATFDAATQTFSWMPSFEQSGEFPNVSFTITDPSGLSDSKSIVISSNHVNRPPQILAVDAQTIAEDAALTVQLSASDPDQEDSGKLVFSAEGLPTGATLDAQSGLLNWTPTYDQSGEYPVTFIISDGEFNERTATTITVNHVNRSPSLDAVVAQSVDESAELRFTVSGNDNDTEDSGLLIYSATNLPEGATFDPATRVFSWTPTFEQSGEFAPVFTISDPSGLTNQQTAVITVNHVNRAPALATIAPQTVDENQLLSVQLVGADLDREDTGKLNYTGIELPAGAVVDLTSGVFSWTPTFEQSGSYTISAQVSDPAGLVHQESFTIAVNHVNRSPEFTALAAQGGPENALLQFTLVATDADAEDTGKLTFQAPSLPEGATLDPVSGLFSWTPTFEQSGDYTVRFEVSDSYNATAVMDIPVAIAHVNREPSLPVVANAQFSENTLGTVVIAAGSDLDVEDDGKLTYSVSGLPDGANFDPATLTFTWTPTFEQSGDYALTATVQDPDGLSASQAFTISVDHVNRPPYFGDLPTLTVAENSELVFNLPGMDDDKEDAGQLTYNAVNFPEGASMDATSGRISWTPTYDQSGSYTVTVSVHDMNNENSVAALDIEVAHVNRPPVLAEIPTFTFSENAAGTATIPAGSDPDTEDAGKLVYALDGLPNGATFDPATRTVSWTPSFEQSGNFQPSVTLADPSGLTSVNTFTLTVENVNRAPSFAVQSAQNGKENSELQFSLTADDPDREDNGKLRYSADNLPTGAALSENGQFSWTPGFDQSGDYTLNITVQDSYGATAGTTVPVSIAHVNRAPVLSEARFNFTEDADGRIALPPGNDPDQEDSGVLTYKVNNLPDGATFDANSREVSWRPDFDQSGSYQISYSASDGNLETRQTITLQVANVNRSPQINNPGNQSVKEGETLRFKVSASDPDKEDRNNLQFSVNNAPSRAVFNSGNGEFTWTPDNTQQGSYTIAFTVTDKEGLTDNVSVTVDVEDVPETPNPPGDGASDE